MATFRINFFSQSMQRNVSFNMIVPNDPREAGDEAGSKAVTRTGLFLHGYTGSAEDYWEFGELAQQYHFAMIMPNGENSFYLDSPAAGFKYCTFVGSELIEYVRKTFHLALTREETFVAGLSMGGFGALHTGLTYPENFGKIVALSSALITHEVSGMREGDSNDVANYDYYFRCFGRPEQVLASTNNPETLIEKLQSEKKELPEIYMACGTEDFLLEENRKFHRFLAERAVKHCYFESPGIHDMVFWREYFKKSAQWIVEEVNQGKS